MIQTITKRAENTATQPFAPRQQLAQVRRVVIKVGTRILVNKSGLLNVRRINHLVADIAQLHRQGYETVLVTSGAVGAGLPILKMTQRPTALADLQMAAAVGQTRLMEIYYRYFSEWHCHISQILLTHGDLKHRSRHLNARNTMLNLLKHRVIPIVNENDVVAVDEIRVGDNDVLSALVSTLIDADLLILLTSPDGLRKPITGGKTQRVSHIETIDPATMALAAGKTDTVSIGGMQTKLQAAQLAVKAGIPVVIASGKQTNVLTHIMAGQDVGTFINHRYSKTFAQRRKRWISYFHRPQGAVIIDAGAEQAVKTLGKSLLPSGIITVEGQFPPGSLINIVSQSGTVLGHGLTEYSYQEIYKIKGHHTKEIAQILEVGHQREEVIHRNNMIIFEET